jgi:hypothetical protein
VKRVDDETATRNGAEAAAEGTRGGCAQPAWMPAGSVRQEIGLGPARGREHVRTGSEAAQHALLGDRQARRGGGEREAVVRDRGVCLFAATRNTPNYVPYGPLCNLGAPSADGRLNPLLGRARITDLRIQVGVQKVHPADVFGADRVDLYILMEADVDDLYDFSYAAPGFGSHGATLQLAGRSTAPPRIFRDTFSIDRVLTVPFTQVDQWLAETGACRSVNP